MTAKPITNTILLILAFASLLGISCWPIDKFYYQYHLEYADRVSKKLKISLLDKRVEVQILAESPIHGISEDEFFVTLDIRLKSLDIDNILLQPDSIVVTYKDSIMLLKSVSVRKASDTASTKDYHVSIRYAFQRLTRVEYRAHWYKPHDSWLKIAMDRFIKVDGDYVPIDTVFVAEN